MGHFSNYLEIIRKMKAEMELVTKSFKSDLDHDFAAIMQDPDGQFLWRPYSSGTRIIWLDHDDYDWARTLIGYEVKRHGEDITWFHLAPGVGHFEQVSSQEARELAWEFCEGGRN